MWQRPRKSEVIELSSDSDGGPDDSPGDSPGIRYLVYLSESYL